MIKGFKIKALTVKGSKALAAVRGVKNSADKTVAQIVAIDSALWEVKEEGEDLLLYFRNSALISLATMRLMTVRSLKKKLEKNHEQVTANFCHEMHLKGARENIDYTITPIIEGA